MVSSELNITPEQFQRILPQLSLELRAQLQPLDNNQLDREEFERLFPILMQEIFALEQGIINL